ncbi:MAG: hypothetical protein DI528_11975 [Shinella sp.]|nr:MAG: hypothetical protein DI528_11975 [Shinella sp.]
MNINRRQFGKYSIGAAAAILASKSNSLAQDTGPVRLVVGVPPGGLTDTSARLFAVPFGKQIGRQVIVENRPGATGYIGVSAVTDAPKDGSVMLFSAGSQIVVNPHISRSYKQDPVDALDHLALATEGVFVVTTNAQTGVNTMQDFIALAKADPGKLNFGTVGIGSFSHLLAELLQKKANIVMNPVHYRGTAPLLPELISNQVQLAIEGPGSLQTGIAAGDFKPLMVLSPKRYAGLPDVPTSSEAGIEGMDQISNWFGVHVPKGLPPELLARYKAAAQEAIHSPEFKQKIEAIGNTVPDLSADAFADRIRAESALFKAIATENKITVD